MTQLLIIGTTILAQGPFDITDWEIRTADQIIPKHIIAGFSFHDVVVPANFHPSNYQWIAGGLVEKPGTPYDLVGGCSKLLALIDAEVDAVYAAVIGNRSDEYNAANNAALAFKAAGYTGAVPPSVQSWATVKGWTTTQATDDILVAAAGLATLRDNIRAQRLGKKEAARLAHDKASLDLVATQWAAALAVLRASAGL